jgi:hypothetical protein
LRGRWRRASRRAEPTLDKEDEVSDQEHEQQSEEPSEEREETMKDLDVPEEEGKTVKGGLLNQDWAVDKK